MNKFFTIAGICCALPLIVLGVIWLATNNSLESLANLEQAPTGALAVGWLYFRHYSRRVPRLHSILGRVSAFIGDNYFKLFQLDFLNPRDIHSSLFHLEDEWI